MKKVLFIMGIALYLAACGKMGPLIPPEAMAPSPINDLTVSQSGERFLLCLSPPSRDEVGRPLDDLAGIRMLKREVLPPDEDCEECPNAYHLYRMVDLEYSINALRYGNIYCLYDTDLAMGKTYQYKAVSIRQDETQSRDSNKVRKKFVAPPVAPVLAGISTETGVELEWTAPSQPESVMPAGFNIYRSESADRMSLRPINPEPVQGTRYVDRSLELGASYFYAVRTVARVAEEMVESVSSNKVAGEMRFPEE